MKRTLLLAGVVAIALQTVTEAQTACTITVNRNDTFRGKRYEISWTPITGVGTYLLEEIRRDPNDPTRTFTQARQVTVPGGATKGSVQVEKTLTDALQVTYRVSAIGHTEPCSGEINVRFSADDSLIRAVRKSIIPLAGSTPGANGALFKTSLRLRRGAAGMSGRLVFHPVGVPGRDTDPSILYRFETGREVFEWDDIVAAFGQSGLGSIDIIPDYVEGAGGWRVPVADVRLYNVAGDGTFGTLAPQTHIFEFLGEQPDKIDTLTVVVPSPQLRLNTGIRSVEEGIVNMTVSRGGETIASRTFTLGRDMLMFSAVSDFAGMQLQPGDEVRFIIPNGGMIPMYSLTDNKTNDPALYYPPTRTITDLNQFSIE